LNTLGKAVIEALNEKVLGTAIPLTEETAAKVGELIEALIEGAGYRLCDDCDERMGEPMRNEGYD
jgi:hypothetical protein